MLLKCATGAEDDRLQKSQGVWPADMTPNRPDINYPLMCLSSNGNQPTDFKLSMEKFGHKNQIIIMALHNHQWQLQPVT